jgi:hypothetical protein
MAIPGDGSQPESDQESTVSTQTSLDYDLYSSEVNILVRRPPPTFYQSVAVPAIPCTERLHDPMAAAIFKDGVHFPPMASPPPVFMRTRRDPLLQVVVQNLLQHNILIPYPQIRYAFRLFLVAKKSGAARLVLDMSPWTTYYEPPPIRLYSAAEVLAAIPQNAYIIEIELKSGFFQITIRQEYWKYYGVYCSGNRYAWTRLRMGHPLAPSIMQRRATTVARYIHQHFDISMVASLDDWLIFSQSQLPVNNIVQAIETLRLINKQKSPLTPTTSLVYLGLLSTLRFPLHHTHPKVHHQGRGKYLMKHTQFLIVFIPLKINWI